MNKLKVAVIFGGMSSEHDISLHSARSVIKFFPRDIYELICIGITKEGKWIYCPSSKEVCDNNQWYENSICEEVTISLNPERKGFIKVNSNTDKYIPLDCVFPVLHGRFGEDGTIQGVFEMARLPYVGCSVLSSAMGIDKDITHKIMESAGIKTAKWMTIINSNTIDYKNLFDDTKKNLGFPVIVKPACEGSSFGISKAANYPDFVKAMETAFTFDRKVIIEKIITGFEVGCAVLEREGILTAGNIDEIEIEKDFFDFEEKYTLKSSKIHLPARVTPELQKEVKALAIRAYKALGCYGLARVDMFITKENTIVFNEVNTLPGFTDKSRYPNMLKSIGIEFPELIEALIKSALTRNFSVI